MICFPAAAQPTDYEALGEAAVQHFQNGEYRLALESFEQLYAVDPQNVELGYNLALTHERLGHASRCLALAEALLTRPTLNPDVRARIEDLVRRTEPLTGRFRVVPRGLRLEVDGQQCTGPCELRVNAGTYPVTLTRASRVEVLRVAVRPGGEQIVEMPPPDAEPVTEEPEESGFAPSWLTWTGVGLTVVGTGSLIGFGLRAQALESDFETMPELDTADEADTMVLLANVGIAVAAVGVALIMLDLLIEAL
ncbi:MAG: hypothetical protein AAGF12_03770 [Myxococcota bacterium]